MRSYPVKSCLFKRDPHALLLFVLALALPPVSTSATLTYLQQLPRTHAKRPKSIFSQHPANACIALLTTFPVSATNAEASDSYSMTLAWSGELEPLRLDTYPYAAKASMTDSKVCLNDRHFLHALLLIVASRSGCSSYP